MTPCAPRTEPDVGREAYVKTFDDIVPPDRPVAVDETLPAVPGRPTVLGRSDPADDGAWSRTLPPPRWSPTPIGTAPELTKDARLAASVSVLASLSIPVSW
jgi:hypothetical protein